MKRERILNNTVWQYVNLAGPQLKPQHILLNENVSVVTTERMTRYYLISDELQKIPQGWRLVLICNEQVKSLILRKQQDVSFYLFKMHFQQHVIQNLTLYSALWKVTLKDLNKYVYLGVKYSLNHKNG